ncbi:MAG: glycine cleavage system protein GcvH [Planctomycetes bacterium]|nr:glycine cleavage system protein GcvH [Planctomycetota bacterium]
MEEKQKLPKNYRYSETHEWTKVTTVKSKKKNKEVQELTATIGITDYAVEKLGDLVHLELPKVGDKVEQGNAFGELESVKTVAELYSLVSGVVVEINDDLKNNIELLKEDPYEDGWLIKVAFNDVSEVDYLMDADAYRDYIQSLEPHGEKEGAEEDEDFFM